MAKTKAASKATSKSKAKVGSKSKAKCKQASNGKNNSKKDGSSSTSTNKGRFIVSPYTNEKVFISQATVKDLKSPQTYRNGGKRLYTITSEQIRYEHYQQVARVISTFEQNLLPPSGMRSWSVEVGITELDGRVLFRPFKGKMELAVLPHLLERIPEPPVWPGKRLQPPDEYKAMEGMTEDSYEDGLAKREMSALSCLAFDELRKHPYRYSIPQITMKWKSPDGHKPFTSRTAAWDHAKKLCEKEVMINRHLLGIGPSGKKLQPFVPSLPNALKVGQLRFIRDGLWKVGQELEWQDGREEELLEEKAEAEANATPKVYTSGLQLFIARNRQAYREDPKNQCQNLAQADKKLRLEWRQLTPQQQEEWNDKVQEQFSSEEESEEESVAESKTSATDTKDSSSDDGEMYVRPSTLFLQSRRQDYRYEQQMKLDPTGKQHFTLAQADRDLMAIWNGMTQQEKDDWLSSQTDDDDDDDDKNKDSRDASASDAHRGSAELSTSLQDSDVKRSESTTVKSETNKKDVQVVSTSSSPSPNLQADQPSINDDDEEQSTERSTTKTQVETTNKTSDGVQEEKKEEDQKDKNPSGLSSHKQANSAEGHGPSELGPAVETKPPADTIAVPDQAKTEERSLISPKLTSSTSPERNKLPAKNQKKPQKSGRIKLPSDRASRRWCLDDEKVELCKDACMEHYEAVMRTVKGRNLLQELEDGFDVMRERGRGRFDMTLPVFDEPQFDFLTDPKKTPWMPVVRAILGDDAVLVHKGCFLSLPGAEKQVYHQDGVHLNNQTQRPCHAINVFVPLIDLHARNGPTEFVLGSHVLGQEGFDKDFTETPMPKAGTPVIFDYRLGHRGLGNSSDKPRPILYTTYSANSAEGKTFFDSVNFSKNMTTGKKYHKIGDLSAKPLSREERRNNRKRSIESRLLEEVKESPEERCPLQAKVESKTVNGSIADKKVESSSAIEAGTGSPVERKARFPVDKKDGTIHSPSQKKVDEVPKRKRTKKPSVVGDVKSVPLEVAKSQGLISTPPENAEGGSLDDSPSSAP